MTIRRGTLKRNNDEKVKDAITMEKTPDLTSLLVEFRLRCEEVLKESNPGLNNEQRIAIANGLVSFAFGLGFLTGFSEGVTNEARRWSRIAHREIEDPYVWVVWSPSAVSGYYGPFDTAQKAVKNCTALESEAGAKLERVRLSSLEKY